MSPAAAIRPGGFAEVGGGIWLYDPPHYDLITSHGLLLKLWWCCVIRPSKRPLHLINDILIISSITPFLILTSLHLMRCEG